MNQHWARMAAAIAAYFAGKPSCEQLVAGDLGASASRGRQLAEDDLRELLARSGQDWDETLLQRFGEAPHARPIPTPRQLTAAEEAELAAALDRLRGRR